MASGLPIIAGAGAVPEVCPEIAGIHLSENNVEKLKDAMVSIYKNYLQYDRSIIREYAVNNHSLGKICDKYIEIYKNSIKMY